MFCSPQDPPDVIYQEAAFEIKEIMDEGRRRHDEVKQARQKALQKAKAKDFTLRPVIDLLPADAGRLVLEQLDAVAERYQAGVKASTDMLFYVNKLTIGLTMDRAQPSTVCKVWLALCISCGCK